MRRLPPLNAIRAFEATGRLGGVQKASEELHVTHGAISRHVKQLEDYLDVDLFDRSHRSLRLNSVGDIYLKSMTSALNLVQEATRNLLEHKAANSLGISTTHSIASKWLMQKLPDFSHSYPNIELSLIIEQHLTSFDNNIDMALRMGQGPWPGFNCTPLMSDELIPVCNTLLLEKGSPINQPADIIAFPLLHDKDPNTQWSLWFKDNSIEHIPHANGSRYSSADILISAAISGQGIALVNKVLVEQDISQGRLVQVLPNSIKLGEYYWLITKSNTRQNRKTLSFIQWIKEYIKRMPGSVID